MRSLPVVRISAALALCVALGGASRRESFAESEAQQRSQSFAGARSLVVDNWRGAITVTAHDGDRLELGLTETVEARTPEDLARARREVKLELGAEGGAVRAVVDGPFRCRDGSWGFSGRQHERQYRVTYDFAVRVPRAIALDLSTVDAGEVRVAGTRGDFAVRNVNGGVEMIDVAGSGSAAAVNGEVRVRFARNPAAACSFKSVNGDVEVAFRPGLRADFFFDTMNGEAYSDFPFVLQPLPARLAADPEREDGMRVYRSQRVYAVRVAGGGPPIELETLNGDILIRNQER
jgi:hypothetical protein